jgi:superfamily II DNA/RNA helicase
VFTPRTHPCPQGCQETRHDHQPSFADLGVPADLVKRLVAMDRPTPFAVQILTLRDSLAGRDLCAKAPTGSGKTWRSPCRS